MESQSFLIPPPLASREELYGKVQDLCSHGYGPTLYRDIVSVLNRASFACVKRLVPEDSSTSVGSNDTIGQGKERSFAIKDCCVDDACRLVYFESLGVRGDVGIGVDAVAEEMTVLEKIWSVFSDYVEFLNCVRNIFLSLDRMFVYIPPCLEGDVKMVEGTVVVRNASGSVAAVPAEWNHVKRSKDEGGMMSDVGKAVGEDDGNRGLDRLYKSCSAGAMWDLWDVGMDCLYKHFAMLGDLSLTTASLKGMDSPMMDAKDSSSELMNEKHSILQKLKVSIVQCIVAELDLFKAGTVTGNVDVDAIDLSNLHKPLLRNCVSIFRSFAHVSHQKGHDVHRDFLHDLVRHMTQYFKMESESWMSADTSSMVGMPSKTSYDASGLLHHIDRRIRQMKSMTSYYYLVADKIPGGIVSLSQRRRRAQYLVQLVEEFLLTPHFTSKYLLHPFNLYPILDQEEYSVRKDAKLLYQLSKRCKNNSSTALIQNSSMITLHVGTEVLRQTFEEYGKERGSAIMRQKSPSIHHSTSPVKPPPTMMTTRDMNNQIVSNLLEYKNHLEYLHKEAFEGEESFGKSLRKVLESVLNDSALEDSEESTSNVRSRAGRYGRESDGGKRIAELLAKYMDAVFKSTKGFIAPLSMRNVMGANTEASPQKLSVTEDNNSEGLQLAVLDLFRHIQSKDVFEAFYRQDLAKRLLLNKSSSIDAERSFVSKLKAECGSGYTSKMEGMFKDIELSKDVMSNYTAHLSGLENSANAATGNCDASHILDMDVQVLTTGYWPVHPQYPDIILPKIMLSKRDEFDAFYKSKYQGRRIAWQNGIGSCILKANFPKLDGPRELNVSLCQALVLMCFNLDDSGDERALTIGQIMEQTGIVDRSEAERVLQSLSMGREGTRVLCRLENQISSEDMHDDGVNSESSTPRKKHKVVRKSISDTDLFTFNANFTSNQRRIRITNIQMKETASDRKKTHESVILDRLHLIDAAIVRIMKARKTLDHRDLLGEVMNQLKFPAAAVDIKKRIESLIEREYMERVEGNVSSYNYLA
jgi:cullin-4